MSALCVQHCRGLLARHQSQSPCLEGGVELFHIRQGVTVYVPGDRESWEIQQIRGIRGFNVGAYDIPSCGLTYGR